jgi:hypothetical protein
MTKFMKSLVVLVLVFASGLAQSQEWLETSNQEGGSIVLMDVQCSDRFPNLKMMMAYSSIGLTSYGCWTAFAGRVHVSYVDGSTFSYPIEIFHPKSSKKEIEKKRDLLSYPKYRN